MGQSIQESTSKICGRQPLKKFTWSILEYLVSNNIEKTLGSCVYIHNDHLDHTLQVHK